MSSLRPPPYTPVEGERLRRALWSGLHVGAADRVAAKPPPSPETPETPAERLFGARVPLDELHRDSRALGVRLEAAYELDDGLEPADVGASGGSKRSARENRSRARSATKVAEERGAAKERKRQSERGGQADARAVRQQEARENQQGAGIGGDAPQEVLVTDVVDDLEAGGEPAAQAEQGLQALFRRLASFAGDRQRIEWGDFEAAVGSEAVARIRVALPLLEETLQPGRPGFNELGGRLRNQTSGVDYDSPAAAARAGTLRARLAEALRDTGLVANGLDGNTPAHVQLDALISPLTLAFHRPGSNAAVLEGLSDDLRIEIEAAQQRFEAARDVINELNRIADRDRRHDVTDAADRTYLLTPLASANEGLVLSPGVIRNFLDTQFGSRCAGAAVRFSDGRKASPEQIALTRAQLPPPTPERRTITRVTGFFEDDERWTGDAAGPHVAEVGQPEYLAMSTREALAQQLRLLHAMAYAGTRDERPAPAAAAADSDDDDDGGSAADPTTELSRLKREFLALTGEQNALLVDVVATLTTHDELPSMYATDATADVVTYPRLQNSQPLARHVGRVMFDEMTYRADTTDSMAQLRRTQALQRLTDELRTFMRRIPPPTATDVSPRARREYVSYLCDYGGLLIRLATRSDDFGGSLAAPLAMHRLLSRRGFQYTDAAVEPGNPLYRAMYPASRAYNESVAIDRRTQARALAAAAAAPAGDAADVAIPADDLEQADARLRQLVNANVGAGGADGAGNPVGQQQGPGVLASLGESAIYLALGIGDALWEGIERRIGRFGAALVFLRAPYTVLSLTALSLFGVANAAIDVFYVYVAGPLATFVGSAIGTAAMYVDVLYITAQMALMGAGVAPGTAISISAALVLGVITIVLLGSGWILYKLRGVFRIAYGSIKGAMDRVLAERRRVRAEREKEREKERRRARLLQAAQDRRGRGRGRGRGGGRGRGRGGGRGGGRAQPAAVADSWIPDQPPSSDDDDEAEEDYDEENDAVPGIFQPP